MADVKQNEEKFIQLSKNNILKIGIKDEEGNPTGEHLEFDLESIGYPLRLNECSKKLKRITSDLNGELTIIKKQEDIKGKYVLSKNEELEQMAWNKFYRKGMEAYDLFFGKDGCKKILNGREPYYTMFDELDRIANQILPLLETNSKEIKEKIKNKYANEEIDVLE